MKLYLDSMLWVYYFEGHPIFGPPTQSFVRRLQTDRHDLVSSHFVLAEVLVIPKRSANIFMAAQYRRFFLSRILTLVPLGSDAAERFADIRASTRIKPADALHLALACERGLLCDGRHQAPRSQRPRDRHNLRTPGSFLASGCP